MHSEALRNFRFDLDKGFPEEKVTKILKDYRKRKFTQQEMHK